MKESITRKELLSRLEGAAARVYDPREARAVALLAAERLWGVRRIDFSLDPGAQVPADGLERVERELAAGRPVQYTVGWTEFCGRRFEVEEGCLIPRPETEELVRWVAGRMGGRRGGRIVDAGTGSGCIAVSLACELPDARVTAFDLSERALAVAARNVRSSGAEVRLLRADMLGDWSEVAGAESCDAVVSNPPYVPQSDEASMALHVVGYEPHEALFVPDDDPLIFYRAVAEGARRVLKSGGELYFETYHLLAGEVERMLAGCGFAGTERRCDLFGRERMVRAVKR